MLDHDSELRFGGEGTDLRRLVEPRAEDPSRGCAGELLQELRRDGLGDDHPGCADAPLSGADERRVRDRDRRRCQVGVLQHDGGVLAAELHLGGDLASSDRLEDARPDSPSNR